MRLGHILVCHSVDPSKLLGSLPHQNSALWYVFLHGTDERLNKQIRDAVLARGGNVFSYSVNRGLARSWNEGLHLAFEAGCDAAILLNDDLHFVAGGYDRFCVTIGAALRQDKVAYVTVYGLETGNSPLKGQVIAQSFACCAITRVSIETIGYFDETYQPAYFEDLDYNRRVHLAGMKAYLEADVLVEHERSSTTRALSASDAQTLSEAFARNKRYYVLKWGGVDGAETFLSPFDDPAKPLRIPFESRHTPHGEVGATSARDKALIVYHYFEKDDVYKENLRFFLDQGLRDDADFVFVIAGGCSVELPIASNIRIAHVRNAGSDIACYNEILTPSLIDTYQKFIFINCSMIGPFLVDYSCRGWMEIILDGLVGDVKLVGTTINILPGTSGMGVLYAQKFGGEGPFPHVQTMLFATDRDCLRYVRKTGFFNGLASGDRNEIIAEFEVRLSALVLANGWRISCLAPEYKGLDYSNIGADINPTSVEGDCWFEGAYFGRSLHPYETIFTKTNRGIRPTAEMASLVATQRRAIQVVKPSIFDAKLASIASAWKGHKNFARWLTSEIDARCVVDLGVDYGYSTICFAENGLAEVYGIDSFEGDTQAGIRDTYPDVSKALLELNMSNVHLIKGFFSDVASSWNKQIDILHIDGLHDYESVVRDYDNWKRFVRPDGVVLFHDTCVPHFGVRKLFDEIDLPKANFTHSFGLGVVSSDQTLIDKIKPLFESLIEKWS